MLVIERRRVRVSVCPRMHVWTVQSKMQVRRRGLRRSLCGLGRLCGRIAQHAHHVELALLVGRRARGRLFFILFFFGGASGLSVGVIARDRRFIPCRR